MGIAETLLESRRKQYGLANLTEQETALLTTPFQKLPPNAIHLALAAREKFDAWREKNG